MLEHLQDLTKSWGVATNSRVAQALEAAGNDGAGHPRWILFAGGVDIGNDDVLRAREGLGKCRREGHRPSHSMGLKYRRNPVVAGRSGTDQRRRNFARQMSVILVHVDAAPASSIFESPRGAAKGGESLDHRPWRNTECEAEDRYDRGVGDVMVAGHSQTQFEID